MQFLENNIPGTTLSGFNVILNIIQVVMKGTKVFFFFLNSCNHAVSTIFPQKLKTI